ncbi:hypothetical protein FK765_25020 [Escherichia coli]|nr:hypothetical protein [Escherichia coli]
MRCIFASECPDFLVCSCHLFSLSQPCCQLHVMLILSHIRFPFRTEIIIRQLYFFTDWICPYISRHLLSLNPLQARCRRYSRGER